jgi:pimeloyl-ACP methyl ester carboxylesterase
LRRWLKRLALALVVGLLGFVFGYVPWWIADRFTTGRFQMKDADNEGVTPESLGLAFENVNFNARDGVPLSGWWVPAPNARGSVVLVHGLNRSRIEMVKKAPFLHAAGFSVLLFDLRRHGESGGEFRSLGFHERQDVLGAFDFASKRQPGPVVTWGVSVGAAATVLAAAEEPKIAGVVSDSSFRSLRDTAQHHVALGRRFVWWLNYVPVGPVAREAVYFASRKAGFDPDAIDVEKAASRLAGRPALFLASTGDERMPQDIALDLAKAAGPKATSLVLKSEGHGHAFKDATAEYEKAVTNLLDAVAPPAPAAVGEQGAKP